MKRLLILQNNILHYRRPLYHELAKMYELTVLHSGESSPEECAGYKEIVVPVKKLGPFFLQSCVVDAVRKGGYDVVIAMFDIRWLANVLAVFARKGPRFLYWGHRYSGNRVGNRVRDALMRRADGVVLYSNAEVDRMMSRGVAPSSIFVAPNTVYVPNHSDGVGIRKDCLLFSGRAQQRKKIDILIRAFAEVRSRIPETVTLEIVGSGDENVRLKAIAEEHGVSDQVIFHGEIVGHEQLKSLFHRAIAYVCPGPVGLAVLHSFAYGVPVVTNVSERHGPEYDNMEPGKNCLVYEAYEQLKEIIVNLCTDQAAARSLGRAAYEKYSKERTLDIMVRGFVNAIENRRVVSPCGEPF